MPYYVDSNRGLLLEARPASDQRMPFAGIGWNWFDHLGSGGIYGGDPLYRMDAEVLPPLSDAASWEAIRQGLDELRPGFIRFGLPPDAHVAADGTLILDTRHVQRLRWLDSWAVANGCQVLIDTFTIPTWYEMQPRLPIGEARSHSNMAPADNAIYARRFVAPLLRHLVIDLDLHSVRWFNPANEVMQYGVFQTPPGGPDVTACYVDMYRQMRLALDDAGVPRGRVGLVGCDCLAERDLFLLEMMAKGLDIDPYVDAYSVHHYNLRFDWAPPADGSWSSPILDSLRMWERWNRYLTLKRKPLLLCEVGTFHYGWKANNPAGAASMDSVLTAAEGVLRMLGHGCGAAAFWQLFDENSNDGWWSTMSAAEGRLQRHGPRYHVYGLLSRYLRPGSAIHPLAHNPWTNLATVHGVAAVAPDGRRSVVLVNDDPVHSVSITLRLPEAHRGAHLAGTVTDRVRMRAAMPELEIDAEGTAQAVIPAFSCVAFHEPGW